MSRSRRISPLAPLAFLAAGIVATPAFGLSFELGDANILLQNRFSIGVALRTQKPSDKLVSIASGGNQFSTNSDDANRNFDSRGEIFSAPVKLLTDFSLDWKNFRIFVRGNAGFDGTLHDRNHFPRSDFGPGTEAPASERERKNDAVESEVGRYVELLDAHVGATHTLFGRQLAWRVGNQIINWGESIFIQNGLNAILAANANRAGVPGAELEEVFVPSPLAWASMELVSNVNIEGWYQLKWEKTVPFESGTFFSTNDFIGEAGTRANIGFGRAPENSPPGTPCAAPPFPGNDCVPFGSSIPRAADREPQNLDQFGGALRLFLPWLFNGTDVSLYATQFHSRLPLISGISRSDATASTQTAGFFLEYPEDIRMYGASFALQGPFGSAIQGEYSLKIDQPLQIDDVEVLLAGLGAPNQIVNNVPFPTSLGNQEIRGFQRHNFQQANLSFTQLFSPNTIPGTDSSVLIVEAGWNHVNGFPGNDTLRLEAPGTALPGNPLIAAGSGIPVESGQFATRNSWGYKVAVVATYLNFLNRYTLTPAVRFDHDVNGITPAPIGNFVEERKRLQLNLSLDYLSIWRFDLGYVSFFGGGKQNLLRDRDFVQLAARYAF